MSSLQTNVEMYRDDRSGFSYRVPEGSDIDVFRAAIEALPGQESPEIFVLHPNADLTFRTLQVRWLFDMIRQGSDRSFQAQVLMKKDMLCSYTPPGLLHAFPSLSPAVTQEPRCCRSGAY